MCHVIHRPEACDISTIYVCNMLLDIEVFKSDSLSHAETRQLDLTGKSGDLFQVFEQEFFIMPLCWWPIPGLSGSYPEISNFALISTQRLDYFARYGPGRQTFSVEDVGNGRVADRSRATIFSHPFDQGPQAWLTGKTTQTPEFIDELTER